MGSCIREPELTDVFKVNINEDKCVVQKGLMEATLSTPTWMGGEWNIAFGP
jgi:hypothetical protein